MQANLAIGFIETSSIALGIEASDAMVKMADVELKLGTVIARGKYIIMVTGTVGEIESAMRAGRAGVGDSLVHHFIIRNVHTQVLEALRAGLAGDPCRTRMTGFSELGLVELARTRTRESPEARLCVPCAHCSGRGRVRR